MKTDWTPHAREYQRTACTFPDYENYHLCGPIEKPSSTTPTIIMKHSWSLTETSCRVCLHPRLAYAVTTVDKNVSIFWILLKQEAKLNTRPNSYFFQIVRKEDWIRRPWMHALQLSKLSDEDQNLLPNYSWNQFICAEKKVQQYNFISTVLRLKYSHILKENYWGKITFYKLLGKICR